jgi:hypothetical protein
MIRELNRKSLEIGLKDSTAFLRLVLSGKGFESARGTCPMTIMARAPGCF